MLRCGIEALGVGSILCCLEVFRPAARGVIHAGYFDCRPANSIGDDVGRFRDNQFARSGDAARGPELRVLREEIFDAIQNVESNALCSGWVMFTDMRAQ
jgi:hypothetical protein